jgi:putative ABC transport system substrate-binding protein
MEVAAKELNVALLRLNVRSPADLDGAFAAMAKENVDALTVLEDIVLIQNHKRIAESAIKQRLPSISFIEYADMGGLFGYGANFLALYRRVAVFVDKILKGAKPADIPIERPTTFEFVINMKTAKALGLTVPSPILVRADRQVE